MCNQNCVQGRKCTCANRGGDMSKEPVAWVTPQDLLDMKANAIMALKLALDFIERVNKDGWILADFEPEMYAAITAIKEALKQSEQEQKPVQVSPLEFVEIVMEKEHLIGNPIFWAEWPNKEKNT